MRTLQSRPWNSKMRDGDIVGTITRGREVVYLVWRDGQIQRLVPLVLSR